MKKGVTCPGDCCSAFYLPHTKAQMGRRASPDGKQIAEMIVPLTPKQARERYERFSGKLTKAFQWKHRGHYFTCKNWDEKTRLCRIYEDRPAMCRDYPYGQECQYGCGYCGGMPTEERAKIREEQFLNQWKAYRAPHPAPKLA